VAQRPQLSPPQGPRSCSLTPPPQVLLQAPLASGACSAVGVRSFVGVNLSSEVANVLTPPSPPIDSPCECEHNKPDSLDARLFFSVVSMYVCKDSAAPAHARTRARRPAAPRQSSVVLAVTPAVTMVEASSMSPPRGVCPVSFLTPPLPPASPMYHYRRV